MLGPDLVDNGDTPRMSDLCQAGPPASPRGGGTDAHSLSYNFTINPRPRPGQPWCEVQGEVDQKVFLSYDCGTAEIKYVSPLGEEVKRMNVWEIQTDALRDTGDLLKEQMPDVTPDKDTDKGPLTLQARMTCWSEDNGHTSASWQFSFNGKLCLLFDSENGHWTVVHSEGRRMKEKWENDRAVTDFFKKVSMGDCRLWYQDFLVHWEKMLKSTASPTTVPPAVQPTATAICLITGIAVTACLVIVAWILCNRQAGGERRKEACLQPPKAVRKEGPSSGDLLPGPLGPLRGGSGPERWCSQEAQQVLCLPFLVLLFRSKRSDPMNPKHVIRLL
ncbi:UL16-binding protein 3-like [Odocoileus virginianus]|uniref:UL16-binding protein 3-like n=1 Tax=Odocoileus virginianus TaxID=9874 RepID=A0ABM4HQ55_ODOVR